MRPAAGVRNEARNRAWWRKGHGAVRGPAACLPASGQMQPASVSPAAEGRCRRRLAPATRRCPKHVLAREHTRGGAWRQTAAPRPRRRRPLAGGQRPRPAARPGPTHVEAGLLHQQPGVHQVHVRRAGSVFQQADDDRRAQAVPGILQGCAWGQREATGRSLFTQQHGKGGRPLAPSFGPRVPHGPAGSDPLLPGRCCFTLGSGEAAG